MLKTLAIIIGILFISANIAYANNDSFNLPEEKINPGSTLYPLKRLSEKIQSKLIFSKVRNVNFQGDLVERRLLELNFIVKNKYLSSLEYSSQRFSAQAGVFIDGLDSLENKDSGTTLQRFSNYEDILNNLRDQFPANSSQWLLLQQNIDTLNILSEKIS
jgi:hypothetical protein